MTQWIISSSILILIVIALRFLLRKRIKPILQYALWALVLVRLLVPLQLGSTGISLQNAVEKAPVMQQMELAEEITYFVYHADGTATGYYDYQPPLNHIEPETPAPQPVPQTFTRQEAQSITRIRDVKGLMQKIWLGGMAVFGLMFLLSNLRFALRLRNGEKAGREGKLPIYITDKVETPCLFGLLRPGIYLPPAVAAEPRHRDYSVAHELTHFRHGDALWAVLRCVCIVLHWYNPLVWWAAVLSREDGEIACDEATITALGEERRGDYGRVLVDLTCRKPTDLLQTATTMTGSAKGLKQRISMIVKRPKTALYALICLILVASVTVGCTFTGSKKPGKKPDDNPPETTETTQNTQPTEPNATTPTQENEKAPAELSTAEDFESFIKKNEWYGRALGCIFEKPEELPARLYFYGGVGDYTQATGDELAFILDAYKKKNPNAESLDYAHNYMRMPVAKMNEALSILGVTVADIQIPDNWVYNDKTDCYYFWVSDAYLVSGTVTKVEKGTEGIVAIYWETNDISIIGLESSSKPVKMVLTMQLQSDGTYRILSNVPQDSLHLPSASNGTLSTGSYKYFVYHNLPNSEVMDFGYTGKPYTLKDLAENGLYAVNDGQVYTISNQAVLKWTQDTAEGYVYFVRQSDPRKIWRTDLHGQNPTSVYESQYGDITFLSYYRDSHDWLLLIENSNRCAFFDMTAKKMTILPQVHYMEQFSYDANQMRIFWKGQLNENDPEMPLGGYTYYYYPKTNQNQLLKDNTKWVTVTPES